MRLIDTSFDQVFRNVRAEVKKKLMENKDPLRQLLTGQTFYLNPLILMMS